ncbi:hypothetical protein AYK61_24215 [Rhodococcus sp. SBT000017]|nr:hypothetical protein ACG96_01525 [Rhodococcus fascians]OZC41942.1 hypothetical protein CHX23_05195 [Rhodococcus fascians]OZD57409.1 hypothetical protein CH268_20180 [Rhodococcus sp. 06-1460-1B]RMB72204.1 hypothetical protein AYK61_24215 [Rhodococcus sp. SBT000017]
MSTVISSPQRRLQRRGDHRCVFDRRHGEEACKIPTFPILSVFDHSQTVIRPGISGGLTA